MNGPFQVAQASGTGSSNSGAAPRVFKLTKPLGDQAVVVNLGYDEKVQVDFSAIANEKITLVHLGDKLIILFDNKATVTVEPFFDSRHDALNNLTIEVAPGRDVSVSEFASLFPITTDQSVLPAAGDGTGGNAQGSGANFSTSAVDPLATGNPLDLLGQEELGNFQVGGPQFLVLPTVAGPLIQLTGTQSLVVDESFIPVIGSQVGPAGSNIDTETFAPVFTVTAQGGIKSQTYALTIGNSTTNVIDSVSGQVVHLVQNGAGEVDGVVTVAGLQTTVFTLTVDAAGHITMTELRAVHELTPGDFNEGINLGAGMVSLTVTVTDNNNLTASASFDLGPHITILDDGPSIQVVVQNIGEGNGDHPGSSFATLTVDESFLPNGSTPNPALTHTTADFSGAFTHVNGADGATIAYALGISAPNVDTGLIDSATGSNVLLVLNGNTIEGRVGATDGPIAFTLSIDTATGVVTLTDFRAVHELNPNDPNEGISLTGLANLVTLTATITDADGDSQSASLDLGKQVTFLDDGPSITTTSGTLVALEVDESALTNGSQQAPVRSATDTASFSGAFTHVDGADGAVITYALSVSASGVDSHLIDTLTGHDVFLFVENGQVVGREGTDSVAAIGGQPVFTLAVDATGHVTMTLDRAVHESDTTSSDETVQLAPGLVKLTAAITDADLDTQTASIDLGSHVLIHDDGPTLSVTAGSGTVVHDETPGVQSADGATDVSFSLLSSSAQAAFNGVTSKGSDPDVGDDHGAIGYAVGSGGIVTAIVNFGADGPATIHSEVFSLTLPNGTDSGLKTTDGREIFLFLEKGVIVGRYDSPNDGNTTVTHTDPAAFAIAIDPTTGQISLAQYVSLSHPDQATAADSFNSYNEAISLTSGTVSISVTVTDGDGDTVTKAADVSGEIKFLDDGPTVTVGVDRHFEVVLDETPGVQSEDDDTTSSTVRHLFDSVVNTGNDPDVSSSDKDHGALGFAIGTDAALDVHAIFGADGPAEHQSETFSLTLIGVSGSVDSGIQTTEGKEIYLTLENNGVIVGRVDTDGDGHVSSNDPAAFAITVDSSGHVATAEWLSLKHGDPHAFDETVQLASGTVSATVTVTDGDGDTNSASADISSKILFEDDAPVAHDVKPDTILDDEAQSLFPPNFGGSGDVSPSLSTVSGGPGTLFDSGADGTKSVTFTPPSGLKAIYELQPSGLAGQETVSYATTIVGGHTILTATGDVSHDTVFTLDVSPDGSYTFKVSEPLVDPVHSTTEENLSVKIGFTVTDGDGDQDTGSLTVRVNDDTPTVEVDQAQHDYHDVTLSTLTLDESIGTMAGDSNAANDDVAGVTAPTLLLAPDSTKAIGIVSTPVSANGTSVAELFSTSVHFGADGAMAAPTSTYSFTLKDDHGNTVSNGSSTGVETNLVVTALAGTPLAGTSDDQRTIYLFKQADGSIVGKIGIGGGGNVADDIALHIVITGSATDPQITVEQYLPIEHGNHSSSDESTSLTFADRDASLGVTLTVSATDGDGDVATDSNTVSLADHDSSLIKIEDDGPTVSVMATSATVIHDETPGIQTAADPNPANDVAGASLPTGVLALFNAITTPGSDPDVSVKDNGAIGFATSASKVVAVTPDFGTDGPAINGSQVLSLQIQGGNNTDSGLQTTDGHHILLRLETVNGVNLIVGRVDGDNNHSVSSSDPAAFAIELGQDGNISIAQYLSLKNPDPGSTAADQDEPVSGLAHIQATVTVTDGDGDHAAQTIDISSHIQFQDDGPTLTVTSPGVINGFDFGTFASNGDVWGAGSGVATGTNGGWTIANSDDGQGGSGAVQLERVGDGYQGMHSSTDGFMVDLDASPHDVKISQTVNGLAVGQTYDLRFEAGAPFPNSAHLEVWFGGSKVGDIAPTGQMQEYEIALIGGSGVDHNNLLEFREIGTPDNQGTYLANISVGEIVIDETPGFQADSNEVAPNTLFDTVALHGSDPDMAPQFAAGLTPVVSVAANFGADGPFGGSPVTGTSYSLTTNIIDSGLTTTSGQPIHLFNENGFVVGRYDSNNSGTIDGTDNAAFAIRVDPSTGFLSLVQYVSLQHPDTASNNEAVFLKTGALSVSVTVTDGDGDTATASADVSAVIRFDDDGPTLKGSATVLATVDEDGLPGHNPDTPLLPGEVAGTGSAVAIGPAGALSALVNFGADGPGAQAFHLAAPGAPVDSGLTSQGGHVLIASDGSTLHGYVESGNGAGFAAGDREVFTLTVASDGSYVFTLTDQIDHPSLDGLTGDNTENLLTAPLDLSSFVIATDGDGDSVALGAGTFKIQIQDDIPVQTSATVSGSVQEDALTDSNSNHQSVGNPEGVGQTTVATGLLTTLVSVGADEPGTFSLASAPTGLPVITSKGEAVHYAVTGDTLTGFVDTNSNGSVDTGERTIFTLKVTSTGAYTFTLLDQIDHPADSPANDSQSVALSFASAIQFTDADGDTITLSGHFTINVEDDIPTTASNTLVTVDEDDLPSGNHDTTSPGDDNTSVSPVTGTLQFSVGADEPGTVSFASLNATAVTDSSGNAVTAGGHALSYLWDSANHTLYATPDGTAGHAAFSVSVDPATGAYSFSLLGQVDHPGHDDPGVAGTQTAFEDNLVINLTYTVTDKDADAVTGTLSVNIDDDMPIVAPSTANNLIVNGSFEQGHDDLGNGQFSIYHTLPGWSTADIGVAGPQGDVPFEIQVGAPGGVPAEDGNALVELDSDPTSGNLSGGDHFNDSGHTNATIQQVVAGTVAGQGYELTFWYAPRPGEGDPDSGSMNVLWNGAVVKSIDSTGMTPGVWQEITVFVDGTGPNNVLGFQGTGQENQLGALLDNVSLVPVTFVDEDGLTGPLSVGNHDSQPGDNVVPNTDGDNNEATSTGNLNIKWGADNLDSGVDTTTTTATFNSFVQDHPDGIGDRSLTFTNANVAVSGVSSLFSHGEAVSFSLNTDGTLLTGMAGTRTVMQVSLSDDGTGQFRVVLLDQLDHAPGNSENDIGLTFNYTATDSDGDAVTGTFAVGVDDDVPVTASNTLVVANEDDLTGGNAGGPGNDPSANLTGILHFSVGADEPAVVSFASLDTTAVTDTTSAAVTVNGVALHYLWDASTHTLYATPDGTAADAAFKIQITDTSTGAYQFTLLHAIDHPGHSDPSVPGTTAFEDNINVNLTYTVTDNDGDATTGTLAVSIDDDTPVAVASATVAKAVDEDGLQEPTDLSTGNVDAGRPGEVPGTGSATVSGGTGSLNSLVSFGADGPGAHAFQLVTQSAAITWISGLGLSSQNSAIDNATVSGNTVAAFAQDGREVFSLTVNDDGSWTFKLLDQLDHPLVNDPATPATEIAFEDTLTLNLGGLIAAVDHDGDSVALNGSGLQISVLDDVPFFGAISPDTVTHLNTVTTGTFDFHVGADDFPAGSHGHFTVTAPTIAGVDVSQSTDSQTGVITLTGTFHDGGAPYYVLTVNPNGTYTFALDGQPATTQTLPDLVLDRNFKPAQTIDFGPFSFIADDGHTVNGGGGVGIDNDHIGNGEHLTIKFDQEMTTADFHLDQTGGDPVLVTWVATDSHNPAHTETGTFIVGHDESGATDFTIDAGGVQFDTLSITPTSDKDHPGDLKGSGEIRFISVGGTEITSNVSPGPFDFTLTGTDFDGDAATGTIHVVADIQPPASVSALDAMVSEAGLPPHNSLPAGSGEIADGNPTNNSDSSEAATGTILVTLGDASAVVTIDDIAVTHVGQTIDGTFGTLTVSSISPTAIGYSYTLTTNSSGDTTHDDFTVKVTDSGSTTASATLVINIVDDVPTAHVDTGSVNEGALLTVNAASGVLVNDIPGADGFTAGGGVVGVRAAGSDTSSPVSGGVNTGIAGAHGTLTLHADGSYTYQSMANNISADATDTFVYTIKDGDGDLSTTTLTVNVANGTVVAPTDSDVTVNEAALDLIKDGADLAAGTVTGSLGTTSAAETDATNQLNGTGGFGTLHYALVTGGNAATAGTFGTIKVNDDGSYTYTLTSPVHETSANNGADTVSGLASESFTYKVTDANGNTTTGTINVNIIDDVPTAHVDTALTLLETASATTGTNLLANDVLGADGAKVTGVDFGDGNGFHTINASGTTTLTTTNGSYVFQADGTWTFDPVVNASSSNTTGNFTYQITDGDGDISTATQAVNITNATSSLVITGAVSGVVEEEQLPGGIDDTTSLGGLDQDTGSNLNITTNVATGSFHDQITGGIDGALSFAFASLTGNPAVFDTDGNALTSGGKPVLFAMDASHNLIGYVNSDGGTGSYSAAVDTKIFTLTLNTTSGAYTFTLNAPIDHPNTAPNLNTENSIAIDLGGHVTATDAGGPSPGDNNVPLNASITVIDDVPVAVPESASSSEKVAQVVNAAFVLDMSGSIDSTEFSQMMAAVKAAGDEIFANSSAGAKFELVAFGSTALAAGPFTTQAAFDAQVDAWTAHRPISSNTDYTVAIQTLMSSNHYTPVAGQNNQVFFLSDGNPNEDTDGGQALSQPTRGLWNTFVNNPLAPVSVTSIGIGDGIDNTPLQQIDVDGHGAPINVSQFSDLIDTLVTLVGNDVTGNVLTNGDGFGADGGRILSVTFDGHTYTWNGQTGAAASIAETDSGGNPIGSPISGSTLQAVSTGLGGHFTFYFAVNGSHVAGDWAYSGPQELIANSNETFAYVLTDNDGDHASAALTVAVAAVNDAPVNTVPGAQSVAEDTNLVFSSAKLISISDIDANGGTETVTLGVAHGTLNLASLTGLTGVSGNGTAGVTFTGTVTDVNHALDGLTYKGAQDFNGSDTLTITTNDNGNTGTGGALSDADTVTITVTPVNDGPINNVPASVNVNEDTAVKLTSFSVTDVDSGASNITVTLSIPGSSGALSATSASGVTVGGNSTALTLTGTVAAIDTFLANGAQSVTYTPLANSSADVTLTINTNDNGNTGADPGLTGTATNEQDTDTVTLNLVAVNDAPAGTSGTVTTSEDTPYVLKIADFGFTDPNDSPANTLLAVKITSLPGAGTLFYDADGAGPGLAVAVTLNQFISEADIAAGKLFFTPAANANGATYATFNFAVQDNGGTANGGVDLDQTPNTITVAVTAVNDAPIATITQAAYTAIEQTNLALHGTGLSISDAVDGNTGTMTVTLSVGEGILTLTAGNSGATIGAGNGTSSVTVTGTVQQINNLLGGVDTGSGSAGTVLYNDNIDNPSAHTTLTLLVHDNGNVGGGDLTGSSTATINVTPVNDAPTTNSASATGLEDAASIAVTLTGADADGTVSSFQITGLPSNGTLYSDALLTHVIAVNGTVAAVSDSATVYFVPAANFNGTPTFQYAAIDNGALHDLTPATVTINVTAVNDAPIATITQAAYTATEQANLTLHGTGLSISDAVDGNTGSMTVTLSVAEGILTVGAGSSGAGVAGSGTAAVTLTGTVAQINSVLAGNNGGTVVYNDNIDNPSAHTTLTLLVHDNGNVGGGDLTGTDTATINVTPVNDAPTVSNVVVTETAISFSVADPDSSSFSVSSPFAAAFPGAFGLGSHTLVPSEQTTVLSGTLIINDGAGGTAGVIGLYLGTANANTFDANNATPNAIYGFGGDDVLTGGTAADFIYGGSGNDTINLANGDFAAGEVIDGGTNTTGDKIVLSNATTVDFTTGMVTNVEILTGSTGTDVVTMSAPQWAEFSTINLTSGTNDTINVVANGDISSASIPSISNVDIGNLVGTSGNDVVTLTGAQLDAILIGTGTINLGAGTGDTINLTSTSADLNTLGATNGSIQGVEAISAATAAAGVTITLSGQTEAISVTGSSHDDKITASTGGGTINAGAGADIVTINSGADGVTWTVDLGTDAAADKIVFNNASQSAGDDTVATVSNFDVLHDKIAVSLAGTAVADGAFQTVTTSTQVSITAGTEVVELANAAFVVNLTADGDGAAVEDAIAAATNGIASGSYTFILYSDTSASADAGIYTVNITDSTNPNTGNITAEHIMTVSGVGFGNLTSGNFTSTADPLVLDLGTPGISFSTVDQGVQFDINGDGVKDQVAWTVGGQEGILALDLNGSGKIESGNELFTPTFNGGHFADGIAALASLDANHDGVIDAKDPAFSKLLVWQDANHNGISDPGELTKLSDLGITSINLTTTQGTGSIDGQNVPALGNFTYANGSQGSFVEANLDTTLGTTSAQHHSHAHTGHGMPGADALKLPEGAAASIVADFHHGSGNIDLSSLGQPSADRHQHHEHHQHQGQGGEHHLAAASMPMPAAIALMHEEAHRAAQAMAHH